MGLGADPALPVALKNPPPSRLGLLLALWLLAVLVGTGLVAYGFGPIFQARDQRRLTHAVTTDIDRAANEASGLQGVSVPKKPPAVGAPVAILEIGRVRLQQVVVEGVSSTQTRKAAGHVPGTAGLGQPGNSVLVGRSHAFGGVFRQVGKLRKGDRLLVTTTQGQSVYEVSGTKRTAISRPTRPTDDGSSSTDTSATASDDKGAANVDDLYGPTSDTRLTLVTSGRALPWNRSEAIVVTATLLGMPFAPTPQNGRSDDQIGLNGEKGVMATLIIALLAFGACLSASVLLHQRLKLRTAYLLTIGPVLATTIIAGETLSRVFPAWM